METASKNGKTYTGAEARGYNTGHSDRMNGKPDNYTDNVWFNYYGGNGGGDGTIVYFYHGYMQGFRDATEEIGVMTNTDGDPRCPTLAQYTSASAETVYALYSAVSDENYPLVSWLFCLGNKQNRLTLDTRDQIETEILAAVMIGFETDGYTGDITEDCETEIARIEDSLCAWRDSILTGRI